MHPSQSLFQSPPLEGWSRQRPLRLAAPGAVNGVKNYEGLRRRGAETVRVILCALKQPVSPSVAKMLGKKGKKVPFSSARSALFV